MLRMTTTAGMVQKAAGGRKKRPPLAVKKQLIRSPSLTLPKGREFVLAVFEEVVIALLFLKKAGMGPLFWLFPSPWRALKNYRYFHFIGVFRRHYRAFTRRSGYDV